MTATNQQPNHLDTMILCVERALTYVCNYATLAKDTLVHLWQIDEFRVLVYLFLAFSIVPVGLFLMFCAMVISVLAIGSSILGGIMATLAFLLLVPFLIGALVAAGFLVLVYRASLYFLTPSKEQWMLGQKS
ncbi:hypothetical protein DM01DRAFT_187646 [Hesseltinella vesiculosa]|uniref:Uncharacterized protein n=1 Tax=Hesseltinella vesiculosa TaxID=101127 RepID=A0A1X2G7D0_9FUNG|nr:hypothetical protein DM01DRAFT_187646 [Hesseltinella vesiculosa]